MASEQQELVDGLGNDELADMLFQEINSDGFDCASVDVFLDMAKNGQVDVLGDVLTHLAKKKHPHWAAELCRMVMALPGKGKDPDYAAIAAAFAYMVDMGNLQSAYNVCKFVLMMKDNGHGGSFFECYDISFIVGHMVEIRRSDQAGQLLYHIYSEDTEEGRIYHGLVPYILGTLIDYHRPNWALELSKQLMYADGDREIDYSVLGWSMAQMVYFGRADWAARICDDLKAQRLAWYDQGKMLDGIAAWGDRSYSQTVRNFMSS